jgi:hypothetical protein
VRIEIVIATVDEFDLCSIVLSVNAQCRRHVVAGFWMMRHSQFRYLILTVIHSQVY